jgi:hypothetical protein
MILSTIRFGATKHLLPHLTTLHACRNFLDVIAMTTSRAHLQIFLSVMTG